MCSIPFSKSLRKSFEHLKEQIIFWHKQAQRLIYNKFIQNTKKHHLQADERESYFPSQVKFICIAHFMYKTIQSALQK